MRKCLCAMMVLGVLASGCGKSQGSFGKLADFTGKRIASQEGTTFQKFIDLAIPKVEHSYCSSVPEMAAVLKTGKADAMCVDMPVAKYLVAQNPDFAIFHDLVAEDQYGFIVAKNSALGQKANEIVERFKNDGTISAIEDIWFSADERRKILPKLVHKADYSGQAGTIQFGCESILVPMSYISRGRQVGFDLDLASRIAYEMNMKIEFIPMAFDAIFTGVRSGEITMGGSSISITEDRRKTYDYIGPYLDGGVALVLKKDRLAAGR